MVNVMMVDAKVKAVGPADGLQEGEFVALVSVFDNVDRYGDVVRPGAFLDDLKAWDDSGNVLPVIWSHDWLDPFAHIGSTVKAEETPDGLLVRGMVDLDNAKAAQVYRLLKGRRVTQFSFAYDVIEGGWEQVDGRDVYSLKKLHLHEVGPCLVGVNPETDLLAVKADRAVRAARAGATFDRKALEDLTAARDALTEIVEQAEAADAAAAAAADDTDVDALEASEATGDDAGDETPDGAPAPAGDDAEAPATADSEDGQPAVDDATGDDAAPSDPSAAESTSTPAQDLARLTLLSL